MNQYQNFIAKSRYSRYLPELKRREHWDETAARWVSFMKERFPQIEAEVFEEVYNSIANLEALPSMRSIMTAGEALKRTHVAAYNCSYLPVDHIRAFDEAMYILLCGTGVGFSVEKKYVDMLPEMQPSLWFSKEKIIVEDSKEGWCDAYQELIRAIFEEGKIKEWDVSGVRPKGAPLKTFGGYASGPEPLVELFEFTVKTLINARGRKLKPIEAHDIMCKIGEVVVVGGVRRSAMISLGDLEDQDHANAKAGAWWEKNGQRALANNSAVYTKKPSMGEFMQEWLNIYKSGSGERGIFNREASQRIAAQGGRRPADIDYGTNPCSEIILRPYQFCNLSTVVVQPDDTIETLRKKVRIAAFMGTLQATLTDFPYLRPIWKENTEKDALLGVSMTGILGNKLLVDAHTAETILVELRELARQVNHEWADKLGINRAAAITCVKPEGTVSQLTQTKSGIHAGHNPFYIRRVRQDLKNPLTHFLMEAGVPHEPCVMKPEQTVVFEFPQKSEGLCREDLTAIEHLNIWLMYQRYWCEHKPSVTISVKEHEWAEVGAWVYKHFDECTGISFLPYDGGTYRQAPYEDCTEEEYNKRVKEMPQLDWSMFFEDRDNVEGVQTLACTAGGCELPI